MTELIATRAKIASLKKRRDELLSTAATLRERKRILQAVKRINRRINALRRVEGWNDKMR